MINVKWIGENYKELLQILTLIVVLGESVTRLTPTKKDDGFVHRIGNLLDKLLDALRVPNLRRKLDDIGEGPKMD